jgi:hypothetical protein
MVHEIWTSLDGKSVADLVSTWQAHRLGENA